MELRILKSVPSPANDESFRRFRKYAVQGALLNQRALKFNIKKPSVSK